MTSTSVLVIDDDRQICRLISRILENEGASVVAHDGAEQGLAALRSRSFDVMITDLRLSDGDGVSLIAQARKILPDIVSVVMTGYGTLESSIAAFRMGAVDYIVKPFRAEHVVQALARACLQVTRSKSSPARRPPASSAPASTQTIVAQSDKMREALILAKRVAQADVPLLVTGERGVGKELIVRAIHAQSPRSASPLIKFNCGAIQDEQLEAMLLGEESPGTGQAPRAGALEQAGSGCLFLHNVSELPKWMQAKLFQIIQVGSFFRLGGNQPLPLTARIAASSTDDLATLAAEGRFFHELYYYLQVVAIHVPALRERRDDICPLADQFLEEGLRLRPAGRPIQRLAFSKEAQRILETYRWPGNVYELSNLVRRAVLFATSPEIAAGDLAELLPSSSALDPVETITIPYASDLKAIERAVVSEVINRHNGNKSAAARALGLHRKTLYRILEDQRGGTADPPLVQS